VPYAVILYLDPETEAAVRSLWERMGQAGISHSLLETGACPHVTCAVYDDMDLDRCRPVVAREAQALAGFSIHFPFLGAFNSRESVVFLGAAMSPELVAVHGAIHRVLRTCGYQSWAHYLPGNWVPHCTLARHLASDQIPDAIAGAQELTLPVKGRIDRVGLVVFPPIRTAGTYILDGG